MILSRQYRDKSHLLTIIIKYVDYISLKPIFSKAKLLRERILFYNFKLSFLHRIIPFQTNNCYQLHVDKLEIIRVEKFLFFTIQAWVFI